MSKSSLLTDLTENLIPFESYPVATTLIWRASDIDNDEELRSACSYLNAPAGSGTAKIFLAERYGGSEIQRNGGGSRCGFDGHYQVKGIGANPLVGQGSDLHHSNGALAADLAIYEAIWGEVLAQTLPYGAVRAKAVLLTDRYIDVAFERSRGTARRALLVREPVIRPAHFERAPYFQPRPEQAKLIMHDARRVRSVIRHLPASLPTPLAGFSEAAYHDPQRHCIEGLCELAHRQAQQMAFCRTRFLMLTTSPSNVAMDGRLLDFNGLNCLFPSDHQYDFEYQLKLSQLMREPAILLQGLSDLCLYLGKYLFDPAFTVLARQQVKVCFHQSFERGFCCGYLELLGVPVNTLVWNEVPEVMVQLVGHFIKLLESRSITLYCPSHDAKTESPLERLVITLIHHSLGQSAPDIDDLKNDGRFEETLQAFVEANNWIIESCCAQGQDASAILNGMKEQARQRLQPRKCLGKIHMLKEIADLQDKYSGNHAHLREALSVMEARALTFAKKVFGGQKSCISISSLTEKV